MNFKNLQYFLAVAENESITKAAETLYVSQQALSNLISKLEKEMDTKLFERSPRFSLTLAGKCLQKASLQICGIHSQLLQEVMDINNENRGELRIGISVTRSQAILPQVIPVFSATHPLVGIELVEKPFSVLTDALSHGTIDLMFGFSPVLFEHAESVEIYKERFFLVIPRKITESRYGRMADKMRARFAKGVTIAAFAEEPFIMLNASGRIRGMLDNLFRKNGIRPKTVLETGNIQTAFALAQRGLGLTVCPEFYLTSNRSLSGVLGAADENPDCFPLPDDEMTQTFVIAYNKERYLSKPAGDFIRLSCDVLRIG
ncbi:MAG: LysR family transcriptional regulator [Clostridiales Family XIII bacterium]|jgi:DNA-binding transcriptional LysR family regulator|nr:LysR family transcriptional regulator [Clostridiales Family XIII bacterium]